MSDEGDGVNGVATLCHKLSMPGPEDMSLATTLHQPGGRTLLSEQLADQLSGFISTHELKPGAKLPSGREIAETYGVSRTVVRDAIGILEQRGLIEARPGSGVFVCDGSSTAVASVLRAMFRHNSISLPELMETRHVLELHHAATAAERAEPAHLAAMAGAIAQMSAARTPGEFVEADVNFHEALAQAAGNRVLTAFLRSLRPLLLDAMLLGTALEGARSAAIAEHSAIMTAIERRDPATAERQMEAHLERSYRELAQAGFMERTEGNASGA